MVRVAVLASGRGTNLQAIIDAVQSGTLDAQVVVVISDNPEAQALERAERHNIEAVVVERQAFESKRVMEQHISSLLAHRDVGLVVLAGYMRILGRRFVEAYRGRIMNIHPSLLPAFPGLDAQTQAWEYGAKVSGCTVHFVDAGVDTGPVILQRTVPVMEDDTPDTLAARILEQEHQALPQAIQLFGEGRLAIEGRRVRILEAASDLEGAV